MDHQSTVPVPELSNTSRRRQILAHSISAVTAGAVVALYFTKYRTSCTFCHITPEQVEHLKASAEHCVRFLDGKHRILVTMAPLDV
jgi:hypothetical protein